MYNSTATNCLLPTARESVARAQGDLRMGLPCLLHHAEARRVAVAVETVTAARFEALQARFSDGDLVITLQRAQAVLAPLAGSRITDAPVRIRAPQGAGLEWFQGLADPGAARRPGGPLHLPWRGRSALDDLAIELVKSAELVPAVMLFTVPDEDALSDLALTTLEAAEALGALAQRPAAAPIVAANLPLEAHDHSRLHVFRDPDGRSEHYAVEIGAPDRARPVLTRLHSACFTGDVLGSRKCDCGPQLQRALARMGEEGAGVLLYLNQEGRGIGLANKMRVYDLQSAGLDTVEANHQLGFEDDERDFRVAASMLRRLGFDRVRLLTNNPAKVETFQANGITIAEQLPLRVGRTVHNQDYLAVKALKSGHML